MSAENARSCMRTFAVVFELRDAETTHLRLGIPNDVGVQVVFRRCLDTAPQRKETDGYAAYFLTHPFALLQIALAVRERWGWSGFIKTLFKLSTRRRNLYLFIRDSDRSVAGYGWVNIGFCQHYRVNRRDVIVGPIWTDEASRGRGLASAGLVMTLEEMFRSGYRVFFIDTRESNIPAIKAIMKAGFTPVAAQWRGQKPQPG